MESASLSATEVVRAVVAALAAERWADVVRFIRPDALREYQVSQVGWMRMLEERTPRTLEDVRQEQPWLPPEVAAFYAEQDRAHAADSLPVMRQQWGVTSLRELEALSPAEFFVRHLSASTPAARIRAALAISQIRPEDAGSGLDAAEAAHRLRWVVLGEVREGVDKAHVVYRESIGAHDAATETAGEVRVITLDHEAGRWWLRTGPPLLDQQGWSFAWRPASNEPASDGG